MATQSKDFKVKNGLQVGGPTNLVNYTSSSPSNPFIGQLWISSSSLYAWSSASTWVLVGDGNSGGGGSASGTPLNIPDTLVSRSASGTFSIGAVDFDTTASPAISVGRIQWNQDFGTPEVGLIGGNVTANIGQHVHAFVTNDEASSLVKGDVVYLFGASGNRASVKKAYNLSDTTSSKTFGVVAETIAAGQTGFVTVFGVVTNLDLSSYSPGDVLWLSASPGKFTNIKPSAPQHLVFIGVVERANAGNGQLFVNVQNGYELEELHSVTITNITDNDILSYNGSSSLWFNQNLATAIQEVDGSGSGIDADLLDGHDSLYFINTSSATQEKTGNITFHGTVSIENLVITGSATEISSTNLSLTDSLIQLAHEQYTTDAVDIGIVGSYGDGTTSSAGHYHASFARDASQNKWKLLSNGPAPVNNVIDYTDPSVEFGVLQLETIEVSSSAVVTNLNADMLDGYNSTYFLSAATASSTYAPLASPALTGTPTAPTATADTNTTQIATTAFVIAQASGANPLALGSVSQGTSTRYARQDHVHPTTGLGLTSGTLAQFAATTSAQLAGVISDKTGSGALVFATSPTLITPNIGVATGTSFNSITGLSSTTPAMDGTAAIGTATTTARADHVHPTDTSRAPIASPALTGTPTAPTATVDNNSTQIATTAYVIGQGYLKSATASSIYIAQSSPKTGTASIVYSDHPTLIRPLLQSPQEIATISATAATASINYDVLSQTVLYYTSSAIGNWHLNIRGNSTNTLSSLLEVGESITLVFGVDQGTTAYYQLNLMIDGTQVTPRWQGGSAPTGGNISGTDIYSYTIIKTAATPTYRVFAALTGFA